MANIFVMGAGSFGTALSVMFSSVGHRVALWGHDKEHQRELAKNRVNNKLLKDVIIPKEVEIVENTDSIDEFQFIIIATPSFAVRETVSLLKGKISKETILVVVSKGIEGDSLKLFEKVIGEELPSNPCVCLSGPSHAEEIAKGAITVLVSASRDHDAAIKVQSLTENSNVRIYWSSDIIGVQLGGALKNIIAFAAGIVDGLELGDNTKAALITRGLAEISRLGEIMGGKSDTFMGIAGVGDLIVTCCSPHSRNHRCGVYVGEGLSCKEASKKVGMVVEGIFATKCACALSKKYNVEMPIAQAINKVIDEKLTAKEGIALLLERPLKREG